MLTKSQISEIREHLEKAQNPVFFFDNDQDGLCSFLLLQRFIGRGRGVAIKSFPSLSKEYFRRVEEFGADYIFILDKPEVSEEFFAEVEKHNLPVVWIDHHFVEKNFIPDWANYYFSEEPTTFLCWQVTERNDDLWLAVIGCIADAYLPNFYEKFCKLYPELSAPAKTAFDVLYRSEIGQLAQILGSGLKDRVTNVVHMMKLLMKARSPHEVLTMSRENEWLHKRFNLIHGKQKKFVEKAKNSVQGNLLWFEYGGDMSISSDLANELYYLYPTKFVVVVYLAGAKANISIRGKNAKKIITKAIEGFSDAMGGGHDVAVGGVIQKKDLETFRERIEGLVEKP